MYVEMRVKVVRVIVAGTKENCSLEHFPWKSQSLYMMEVRFRIAAEKVAESDRYDGEFPPTVIRTSFNTQTFLCFAH